MTSITIGKSDAGKAVKLDIARLIVSKLLVTSSSGGGKSYLLRKTLEQVSEHTQTIVIDVEGEFATLREKRDMVLAGPNGEVPAEARSAGLLCRRLMELNLSAVIDVSELKPSDRRSFVKLFCNTMVELPRSLWRPCFVCIDETHEYAPEGESSDSTDAVALLGSKGRKRGYCLLAATQRLSKLNKDVAAECKNQFIGQMQLDVDLKRAAGVLGFGKDRWPEIRDLSPPGSEGEFFAFGPALNHRGVIKMRGGQVETTHPKAGQGRLSKPPEASTKIKSVLGELTDLAKKADEEAKTLADAQKQIKDLQRQVKAAPKPAADQATIDKAIAVERSKWDRESKQVSGASAKQLSNLRSLLETAMKFIVTIDAQNFCAKAGEAIDQEAIERSLKGAMKEIGRQLDAKFSAQQKDFEHWRAEGQRLLKRIEATLKDAEVPVQVTVRHNEPFTVKSTPPKSPARQVNPHAQNGDGDSSIGKGAVRRIMVALAQHPDGLTYRKIGVFSGVSTKGGSFSTYLSRARQQGWIVGNDSEGVRITDAGLEALGSYEPLPLGRELAEYWLREFGDSATAKIFQAVLEAYPNGLTHDEIGERSGVSTKGGSFSTYLSRLRSRDLIVGSKSITASEDLF